MNRPLNRRLVPCVNRILAEDGRGFVLTRIIRFAARMERLFRITHPEIGDYEITLPEEIIISGEWPSSLAEAIASI